MRRAPGVDVDDGATGRRAVVAGTAIDVWDVVPTWRHVEGGHGPVRAEIDARGLRLDVASVHELARTGLSDEMQLAFAASEGRM